MSLKTFDEYKDSEIDIVGLVPKEYNIVRLKFLCDIKTGDKDTVNRNSNGKYPFYVRSPIVERIDTYSFDGEAVLMAGDGVGAGKVFHYVKGKFDYHQRVYNFYNFKQVNPKFIYYYMTSLFSIEINKGSAKSTVDSVRLPMLENFKICYPNLYNQQQIANYLDKKTTKIDATIAKNEELIQLLEEKRVALINQVVTKGLNPNVPMKDSGVEWIGEIPEHWEVSRLKFLINKNAQYGANCEPESDETKFDYRYVRITDIDDDASLKDNIVYLCKEDAKGFILKEGNILFARSGATVGKTYLYDNSDGDCCFAGYLIRYIPNKLLLNPKYLLYFSFSKSYTEWIKIVSTQATIQNVSADKYDNLVISLPRVDEQNEIVSFLDDKITNINKSISKIQENIALLEEYKTSLIHHVVTGKIDVRGEEI